jgi:hypothetical protein
MCFGLSLLARLLALHLPSSYTMKSGGVCSPTVHSVSADGRRQWVKTDTSHVLVVRTLRDDLPLASLHVSHHRKRGASLYPRFRVFYQPPATGDVIMGL